MSSIADITKNLAATKCDTDITFHIAFILDRDPVLASLLIRLYDVAQRSQEQNPLERDDPLLKFGMAAFTQWLRSTKNGS